MDEAAQEYFKSIEEYFIQRRGRPLILSPNDVRRVARWHEDGIPLQAARDGIDMHFDRLARRGRAPRRAITLAYVEDDVLDAWAGARVRRTGRATPAEAAEPATLAGPSEHARFVEALEASATALDRGDDTAIAVAAKIRASADKLRSKAELFDPARDDHDEQRVEDHLRRLEKSLQASVREILGDELERIASDVEQEAADKRQRMPEKTWERVREQLVSRKVRERFGLPRLSLFYT